MRMMTVPDSFKWSDESIEELNSLTVQEKKNYLKHEEIKIRQSLGEAVPTIIFKSIASKIAKALLAKSIPNSEIKRISNDYCLYDVASIVSFIESNPLGLSFSALSKIAEFSNTKRTNNAAYYTNKSLITEMLKHLPETESESIRIIEPSAGVGNFVPMLVKKFESHKLTIDLVDIDNNSALIARALLKKCEIPENCSINFIVDDFLTHLFGHKYDYAIGNPPFFKMRGKDQLLSIYRKKAINKTTNNICSFFLDKAVSLADHIALVFPKFILNTPEFAPTREYLSDKAIECIIDFGEKGFPGVLIETIALFINNTNRPKNTEVVSITKGLSIVQRQRYIFDSKLPYWIIYRNDLFDSVCRKLDFDVFSVFRDRQLSNRMMKNNGTVRVIKSRNISDDGTCIIDIPGYDAYINPAENCKLAVMEYLNNDTVYLTPNMTYYPRVMRKPAGVIVNGSVAILIPKTLLSLTDEQCKYFSSKEYREFYQIARNYQTRSLNVDSCSVFFYGVLRKDRKEEPITERYTLNEQLSFLL